MFGRWVEGPWRRRLVRPFVHVVLGARQTGKSTLLRRLWPDPAIALDFSDPAQRAEYLRRPEALVQRCRALPRGRRPAQVVVDEAQNVPAIFDAVQHLWDSDRRRWRFVLCGSSVRKLRVTGANLLPGRSMQHHLYPLVLPERPPPTPLADHLRPPSPLALPDPASDQPPFPVASLEERLLFGDLPGVVVASRRDRGEVLRAYTLVYLQEELRREALVKDWPAFARFLQLAAAEAGRMINYAAVSREAGVSLPTVKAYYQVLEDMFVGFRVTALSGSPRKSLLSTERFLFFDLGVRNAAAEIPLEKAAVAANPGPLFEQWVGVELWKRLQYLGIGKLHYFRTKAGVEVDFVLARAGRLTPIEVKWTERPTPADTKHLRAFLDGHRRVARRGYLVCRCPEPLALDDRVTALPWFLL